MCLLLKCNSCLLSRWDVAVPPKIQNRIRVVIDYFDVSTATFIHIPKYFTYMYILSTACEPLALPYHENWFCSKFGRKDGFVFALGYIVTMNFSLCDQDIFFSV